MLLSKEKKPFLLVGIQSGNTNQLKSIFTTINGDSCPFQYNFHLHTNCSDGQLSPESLMEQALQIGLQGLAITDHHSVEGYFRACEWMFHKKYLDPSLNLPHLWTGIEITSNLNGTNVHILGYGFDPHCPTLQKYLTGKSPEGKEAEARQVINVLHEAGALVVLAHPARYRRPAVDIIEEVYQLGIDGVETYYSYGNSQPWQPSARQTETVKKMADKYHLLQTCGTDTHGNNILVRL